MNKKTLIAGLLGVFVGASVIPDYGWLLGSILGALLGQLLHLSERLGLLESQVQTLISRERKPQAKEAEPTIEARPSPPPVETKASTEPVPSEIRPPSDGVPQAEPVPAFAARTTESPGSFSEQAQAPTLFDKALERVRRFFLEGNPIVRMGMVVMLFGLSFLVKYAAGAGLFPIHLRLAVIALIAIALLIIGWRTRLTKNGYGLVLQGGGIGALYLTVFAATKLYVIFPPGLAFALMLVIVFLGVVLAVLQNAQVLALMATAGGFLAPILTSDGSGNHVLLFSFYLLLNLGVLAVALFKTWRWLNWLGFIFTFTISSAWGVLSYEPQFYNSTQPFLLAFFALYLCVSILFSIKQKPTRAGLVDGSLIFGLPIVGFGLQAALLGHTEYGLAISALILAVTYLILASVLWQRYAAAQRLLVESFIALGVGFATIAIPLALDADWTSATWALEAAGLIWVGLRQKRLLPRIAGYGLYLAAVLSIFVNGPFETGDLPIITGDFIGFTILAFAAFASAYVLHKNRDAATRFELLMQWLPVSAGLLWWLLAGLVDIEAHVFPDIHYFAVSVVFASVSLAVATAVANRLQWQALATAGYSLLPLIVLISLFFLALWIAGVDEHHPGAGFGLPALQLFGLVQYRFLWRHGQQGMQKLLRAWHVITAWLWLVFLFWEAAYWQREIDWSATTSLLVWFACFAFPFILLMALANKPFWPFSNYRNLYKAVVPIPSAVLLMFWFLTACRYSGATLEFHLPVLNPLDLAQLAVIVIFAYAVKNRLAGLDLIEPLLRYGGLAVVAFMWINVVVLRSVHHYSLVPYESVSLWNSATVQMALSIVWTLCALAIMIGSRRLQLRPLWMVGAGLLALVVIKLFTKDLTGSGTLPRVISFMAVGAIMLVIGYLSPIPAARRSLEGGEATL